MQKCEIQSGARGYFVVTVRVIQSYHTVVAKLLVVAR